MNIPTHHNTRVTCVTNILGQQHSPARCCRPFNTTHAHIYVFDKISHVLAYTKCLSVRSVYDAVSMHISKSELADRHTCALMWKTYYPNPCNVLSIYYSGFCQCMYNPYYNVICMYVLGELLKESKCNIVKDFVVRYIQHSYA